MVQTAVPDSDISTNDGFSDAWEDESGGTTNRYVELADSSDSTYVYNNALGSTTTLEVGLGTLSSPGAGTRTLRFRAQGNGFSSVTIELFEGSDSKGSFTETPPGGFPPTVTEYDETITDSITDYSNLSVKLTADDSNVLVMKVEFEVPDAGGGGGGGDVEDPTNPEAFLMFL